MYEFPKELAPLKNQLRKMHVDVGHVKTERQALFLAKRVLGSEIKFPAKGQPCFMALLEVQKTMGNPRKKRRFA